MVQTTDDGTVSTQATKSKKNEDSLAGGGGVDRGGLDGSIENLSTAIILAKFKRPKLTKTKKSDFAKANFGTDFLTPKAKKAFIHLQKAFTKAPILRYFDPEHYIWIETDALWYTIGGVFRQMTLDQPSFNHITHENHSDFSKSEIS